MKVRAYSAAIFLLIGAALWQSGCGSSSANQEAVTVSPPAATVLAATTQVFTATVTGPSSNTDSTWTCSYVYTPAPTTANPTPKATPAATCTSGQTVNGGSIGTWSTSQTSANNSLSYTAPALANFPNPVPTITFTAASVASSSKKGTVVVSLDSGVRLGISPISATAPVGVAQAQTVTFTAALVNSPPANLNWAVMQPVVTSSNTDTCNNFPAITVGGACGSASPLGKSCSPSCGSIVASSSSSANGVFTAPASLPTNTSPLSNGSTTATQATSVIVVVWAGGDTTNFAEATITLVDSSTNPITFTGLQPTTIAAGGVLQDVWLDAKNLLTTTSITFTDPTGLTTSVDPTETFNIPITKAYCTPSTVAPIVNCDATTITRIRLSAAQIQAAGNGAVTVHNIPGSPTVGPGCSGTPTPGGSGTTDISCPITLVYASPAIVGALPDSIPQNSAISFGADGGYFGNVGNPLVQLLFNGNAQPAAVPVPRQVAGTLPGGINSPITVPGLYPISVSFHGNTAVEPAPTYQNATTDIAVQPTFATAPAFAAAPIALSSTNANLAPSSMVFGTNRTSGQPYAVITDQAADAFQIVSFGPNGIRTIPTGVSAPIPMPPGSAPTSIAIDNQIDLTSLGFAGQDLGVIVASGMNNGANDGKGALYLVALPSGSIIGSPISLAGLIQGTNPPLPYAVGVDPNTHYAVVAFGNALTVGFGFIVDVNPLPHSQTCFAPTGLQSAPCPINAVSLSTGPTPQVVMQPNAPLAYVTPGGAGVISAVNLLQTDNVVAIPTGGVSCTSGTSIVTVSTATPNNLNPAAPGVVLINGVAPTSTNPPINFNGTYVVNQPVTTYTFTYTLPVTCPNVSGNAVTSGGGSVTFGNPYYTVSISGSEVGGAINPVTRMLALADPGNNPTAISGTANAGEIVFVRQLDQNTSSLTLTVGSCNGCTPNPSGPEVGVRDVAWDPYTNLLIAYNPAAVYNTVSLINPGGVTANGLQSPYRIIAAIPTNQTGTGTYSYTPAGASASTTVTVNGAMAYDPNTNLVLVANAGSNTLSYMDLDPGSTFKKFNIADVLIQGGANNGGVPSAQPPLNSSGASPAVCDPTQPTNQFASCMPHAVTVGQQALLRIIGQGFPTSSPSVRLDGSPTGVTVTNATSTEIDVTVAASRLNAPHVFALDVSNGSTSSNTNELFALQVTPAVTCGSGTPATNGQPEGVAIDDIRHVAVITNYNCNTISLMNMDTTGMLYPGVPYGAIMSSATVGANPIGVAVIPRLGYAVTANNGDSSASIVDISAPLTPKTIAFASANCTTTSGTASSTNVCVGIAPTGVAIDQDRALAIVANTGGNSISTIDLTTLALTAANTGCTALPCAPMQLVATSGPPTAVAVDPNRDEAVVTNLQNAGTVGITGGLDVINLTTVPPSKSTTTSINTLTANPTGIVYDPAVSPALFYVTSTQENAIYTFNPDSTAVSQIRVGINPYSIGYNYQTGTILSINSTSDTSSVIDAVGAASSVFSTRETLGLGSQSQFSVAVDNFTNNAVVVDQNNNRILVLPLP